MLSKGIRSVTTLRSRYLHSTPTLSKGDSPTHSRDLYNKEADTTPPPDSSIHRIDPSSDDVQKPHEPPSGWSRAGIKTKEYESVSKAKPYAAPGQDRRYGGKEEYGKEKGPETSKPGEGPEGKASRGRKPEGR
ncbi:hypothetical protein BDZ94DRAFT_594298 [Collybia nuda]|uniref:Uncharacterized protein n=1 Tax=Collybia nuda TaxID=64659 RepID=A0A9P6CKC7_9AGAR|nr:hypothetical protein BDZ94DRAFT_594298 [Collybia nuda]